MKNTSSIYLNKYIKILDKNNNLIASGRCKSLKPDFSKIIYISFDDKWFYGNKNLIFTIVDYIDTYIPSEPPKYLIWDYWKNHPKDNPNIDVYRDFSYDEIDPPIKPYIDRLNNIHNDISTVVSCCGHDIDNWYIGFKFSNINILSIFLQILNTFDGKLRLVSDNTYLQFKNLVLLKLEPDLEIDDRKMILLNKFINRLERKFNYIKEN